MASGQHPQHWLSTGLSFPHMAGALGLSQKGLLACVPPPEAPPVLSRRTVSAIGITSQRSEPRLPRAPFSGDVSETMDEVAFRNRPSQISHLQNPEPLLRLVSQGAPLSLFVCACVLYLFPF